MTPTLRTLDSINGYLENTKTVVVGDRLKDINWVGINVNLQNYLSDGYRNGNEDKIADLSNLSVHKQGEKGNLLWDDPNFGINVNWQYPTNGTKPTRKTTTSFVAEVDENTTSIEIVPTAASSGAKITVNGNAVESGKAYQDTLTGGTTRFVIKVTAKNGSDSKTYTLNVSKKNSNQVAAQYTYTDYDSYTDSYYPDTPGTFTVTQYMALFSDTDGAEIKYTVDGSDPKTSDTAKVFDQTKFKADSGFGGAEVKELITIGADTDNWDGTAKQTKVAALAEAGEIDLDKLVVWSGHDDYEIHDLLGHLDTLITAAQNIVDYGPETAMRTSVRNTGGSDGASFAGDRYANGGTGHFICMNGSKANVLAGEDYTAVDELDKKYRSDYSGGMSGASRAVQGVCIRALAMSGDTLFQFFERFDQLV